MALTQQHQSLHIAALIQEAHQSITSLEWELHQLRQIVAELEEAYQAMISADPPVRTSATQGPLILIDGPTLDPEARVVANGLLATTGEPLLTIDAINASRLAQNNILVEKQHDPDYHLHSARRNSDRDSVLGMLFGEENDLTKAKWAMIVPAGEDAALIQAMTPLIAKRCADQGLPVPSLTFRAGETCGEWLSRHVADLRDPLRSGVPVFVHQPGESSTAWLSCHGVMVGPVDPRRGVPFYLLIVARPGALYQNDDNVIPFSFQYELDLFWGVGRVCFTDPQTGQHDLAAYTAYAEQVVATEQAWQPAVQRHIAYFGTRHTADIATRLSTTELLQPLIEGADQRPSLAVQFGFTQQAWLASEATKENLGHLLRGEMPGGLPALLFSANHGLGFPLGHHLQTAHQGALICQDWPGAGPLKRQHWFAAEDLDDSVQLNGMIVVNFACYSMGCPQEDQFVFIAGQARPQIAPYAMVAQLPQRMLTYGALAVLGHVDRAWSHSFRTVDTPAQTQRFEALLGRLMRGDRVGAATDAFNMVQGELAARLADRLEQMQFGYQMSPLELSSLWVARNDARNYALLGDPAVRLPFAV